MSGRAGHLRAVDRATGEAAPATFPNCDECQRKADEIYALHRDLRAWAIRYRELQRDKAVEAREHPCWPVAQLLFSGWRKRCNHPKARWTEDRFWACEAFLSGGRYGKTLEDRVMLCARAIAGAGFDAFEVKRKNQTVKRFDEWSRIFDGADKFEDFCNRAPLGWRPTLSPQMLKAIGAAEARMQAQRAAKQ